MGGGSRSRSRQTTNVRTVNTDMSGAEVGGSLTNVAAGGDIENLTMTDHGAVSESFDFARDFGSEALWTVDAAGERSAMVQLHAMDHVGDNTARAMDQVSSLSATQTHVQRDMLDRVSDLAHAFQSQGTSEQLKLVGFVAGGVLITVVLVVGFTARGKK